MGDLIVSHFFVVHLQDAGAALTKARAIVFEVEYDGMFARRERLLTFPAKALKVEEIIEEHRLAFEQIHAIAAEPAAHRGDHSIAAALRDLHFGSDSIRLVQDV